jgi:hypothetical protein
MPGCAMILLTPQRSSVAMRGVRRAVEGIDD